MLCFVLIVASAALKIFFIYLKKSFCGKKCRVEMSFEEPAANYVRGLDLTKLV